MKNQEGTTMNEQQMRDFRVPFFHTEEELLTFIRSMCDHGDDYGTAVYAMSLAAVATFNYMSHVVGASGAQAGFASLDAVRRMRGTEGPFMIVELNDMLYPQCNPIMRVCDWVGEKESTEWLAKKARERLVDSGYAIPEIIAHWKRLARMGGQ